MDLNINDNDLNEFLAWLYENEEDIGSAEHIENEIDRYRKHLRTEKQIQVLDKMFEGIRAAVDIFPNVNIEIENIYGQAPSTLIPLPPEVLGRKISILMEK